MHFSRFERYVAAALGCSLALTLSSCRPKGTPPRPAVQYVRDILTDRSGAEYKAFSAYDPASPDGPVCLVGESVRCLRLSEVLMGCDLYDNVTGALAPDGLPDFAGESILSLFDEANTPYDGYLTASNTAYLRELAVRHVFESLDTVTFISNYDKEGMGRKKPAKMVLLLSPYMAAYGRFDADTLFSCLGKPSPVFAPLDVMLDRVFGAAEGPVNVGVIADSTAIAAGVYETVFEEKTKEFDATGSVCICGTAAASGGILTGFLDAYEAAGYTKPLSALLVDDPAVRTDSLLTELDRIRVEFSDESLRYGKMLSPGFRILDAGVVAAQECYRRLRESNTFTHNISYPTASALVSYPLSDLPVTSYAADGSLAPDFKFNRTPSSDVETYRLLQYGGRYVPAAVLQMLQDEAPKTYHSYVQN